MQPLRAHAVLDQPGEFGDAHRRFCVLARMHEVDGLDRPSGLCAEARQPIDGSLRYLAICIDDQDDVRRVGFKVADAEVQGIALTAVHHIGPFDDLGSFGCRDRGGVVGTIIRNDQEPVRARQLRQDGPQSRRNHA